MQKDKKKMQKHKKRKKCKKSNKIKKCTFAPAISTSYLLYVSLDQSIPLKIGVELTGGGRLSYSSHLKTLWYISYGKIKNTLQICMENSIDT